MKELVEQINNGTATKETYIELLKVVFSSEQLIIPTVINLFEAHIKSGKSHQEAFDAIAEFMLERTKKEIENISKSSRLNDLLALAQFAERAYRSERALIKEGKGSKDRSKTLYSEMEFTWRMFRIELDKRLPVRFRNDEGIENIIRASAAMSSDRMLYYSNTPLMKGEYCNLGINLNSIVNLEPITQGMNLNLDGMTNEKYIL